MDSEEIFEANRVLRSHGSETGRKCLRQFYPLWERYGDALWVALMYRIPEATSHWLSEELRGRL